MIPAAEAWRVADKIVAALAPYCARIEVAGSLRRARPQVGDIDIVALPHPGQEEGLRLRARARCRVVSEGRQALVLTLANGWDDPVELHRGCATLPLVMSTPVELSAGLNLADELTPRHPTSTV